MRKELKIIKRKMQQGSEDVTYIDETTGKGWKRPRKGVPRSGLRPLVDQEGASAQNGIRVRPKIDTERKKRGKREES